MDPADIKKWLLQKRMAEQREKAELRNNAPEPALALARGLALIDFADQAHSSTNKPLATSPEDLRAYQRWAAVRLALRVA